MHSGAHVKSLEALARFRAALCLFAEEASQALASNRMELQRFVDWIEHDQLQFWKSEIRAREARVAEALADLHRCLAATIDPNRTPSCYAERKLLQRAKEQLEEARDKLEATRRWIPEVHQAVFEYRSRTEPLESVLATGIPAAISQLDRLTARLEEYLSLEAPSTSASPTLSGTAHVAQPPPTSVAPESRPAKPSEPVDNPQVHRAET